MNLIESDLAPFRNVDQTILCINAIRMDVL